MRLLVLGGSGFVSGWLCRHAIRRGHEVWCVTRGKRELPEGVHGVPADRNDAEQLKQALMKTGQTYDAVLDCICFNACQAEVDMEVLPAFSRRIIVISTDSVYHPDHKAVPQDENGTGYMQDGGYGALKRQMEIAFEKDGGKRLTYTIFRPGHIFGAGSFLGCFPEQSRQPDLLEQMKQGKPMRLVGGGEYLIHPIYVGDLVRVMLDSIENEKTHNQIFCIGGPDVIRNRDYYEMIGELMDVPVKIESIDETGYLEANPQYSGYLCHRAYTMEKLAKAGIRLPDTPIKVGLKKHMDALLVQGEET